MSLFPNEDILTKEIVSWKSFRDSLSSKEDRESFRDILNDCYKYATAINAKGQPFPTEPLIMALLLSQHKMIDLFICIYFDSLAKLANLKSTLIRMVERNMKEKIERRDWRKENEISKFAFLTT
jgi:hypothetical protein